MTWNLLYTMYAPLTLSENNSPEPIYDQKAKKWRKLPPKPIGKLTMYVTPAGIMGVAGEGIVMKDRGTPKLGKAYQRDMGTW